MATALEMLEVFPLAVSTRIANVRSARAAARSIGIAYDCGCPAWFTFTVAIGASLLRICTCARLVAVDPSMLRGGLVHVRMISYPLCTAARSFTAKGT